MEVIKNKDEIIQELTQKMSDLSSQILTLKESNDNKYVGKMELKNEIDQSNKCFNELNEKMEQLTKSLQSKQQEIDGIK